MSFTEAELDAMRAADAEIETDFCMTPEEIAESQERDARAIFERRSGGKIRSAKDGEAAFRKFFDMAEAKKKRLKAYYRAHREELNAYRREYYRLHRETYISKSAEYYRTHKDECRKRTNEYRRRRYRTDPDYAQKIRDKSAAYRQRKKQAEGGG